MFVHHCFVVTPFNDDSNWIDEEHLADLAGFHGCGLKLIHTRRTDLRHLGLFFKKKYSSI